MIFIAGAAVQWLRDSLKIIEHAQAPEQIATSIDSSGEVYAVRAFTGLGAPYWNPYAWGTIFGLSRGTGREEIIRATLEAVAYQTRDVLDAMQQDLETKLTELRVDGGTISNEFVMQFQADIIGTSVLRPEVPETTALGAAYLADRKLGDLGQSRYRQHPRASRPGVGAVRSDHAHQRIRAVAQRSVGGGY